MKSVDLSNVLVVSQEKTMRKLLGSALKTAGYAWTESAAPEEVLQTCSERSFDAVILDLETATLNRAGLEEHVRNYWPLPLIVLSEANRELDKVAALDAGADDYLTKPFGMHELLARVRAILRRVNTSRQQAVGDSDDLLRSGELALDLRTRKAFRNQEPLNLTPLQFKLLSLLMKHSGRVLTQRFLLQKVWGPQYVDNPNYLRVFIAGLRAKIEDDPADPTRLLTEKYVGYVLVAPRE